MSYRSWLKEFYPVPASNQMTNLEALKHAHLKFTGALPENLAKHGLKFEEGVLKSKSRKYDFFTSDTCSLCQKYIMNGCRRCPLFLKYAGSFKTNCSTFGVGAFSIFRLTRDPKPMLAVLERLIENLEKKSQSA